MLVFSLLFVVVGHVVFLVVAVLSHSASISIVASAGPSIAFFCSACAHSVLEIAVVSVSACGSEVLLLLGEGLLYGSHVLAERCGYL